MLTYALNRSEGSLYEQLYRALRLDIESGALLEPVIVCPPSGRSRSIWGERRHS